MSRYVDTFIIPIKKKKLKAYTQDAKLGRKVWMDHGALDYYECVGTVLKNPWGMPFTKLCKLKSDETLIFAFITYKSKAHRDRVNTKVLKDPRMEKPEAFQMPFDMKRFTAGEFKTLIHT